jgi:hypothetical protein
MSDKFVPVCGGCLCEAVRYEADVNLCEAFYCHCKTCQKTSGAPAEVGVMVNPETLIFTKEEPKSFQSSPFGIRSFCRHCGSRLTWVSPDRADWTVIFVGSLDHPERVVPTEHLSVESQLPWHEIADDLPRNRTEDDVELLDAWASAGLTHEGKPLSSES